MSCCATPLRLRLTNFAFSVTVIIQSLLTTLIVTMLVQADLRNGKVKHFGFSWPDVERMKESGWAKRKMGSGMFVVLCGGCGANFSKLCLLLFPLRSSP